MNTGIRKVLIAIVILSLIALMIYGFLKTHEYVEEPVVQPLQGEAAKNPLYAGRLFLKGMGIPTTSLDSLQSLTELPDSNTVLVIESKRETLTESQQNRLLDWVGNGGHLILTLVPDWSYYYQTEEIAADDSDTQASRNTEQELLTSDDPIQQELRIHSSDEAISFKEKKSVNIRLAGVDHPLEIGANYYEAIALDKDHPRDDLEQIKIGNDLFIIRQPRGNGLITVVSDLAFVDNYNIQEYDHAELFWHLIHGKHRTLDQPTSVWLIHSDEMPNLLSLIWRHFWAFMLMLGGLFLIWVLRVSRRFGPMIPKASEDRRNLLEHIDASGEYYWKQQQQHILLNSSRQALQQRLQQRIPGWQAMTSQAQATLLAKRTPLSEAHIALLLSGDIARNAHEFTETIKQLEYIRTQV